MATLQRIDKNGTEHWLETKCPKCNGTGFIECYGHVQGGKCFECGGTGRKAQAWKVYTPEYQAKLDAKNAVRQAKVGAEKAVKEAKTLADNLQDNAVRAAYDIAIGHRYNSFISDIIEKMSKYPLSINQKKAFIDAVAKKQAEQVQSVESAHVGSAGEKIQLEVEVIKAISFETVYGTQTIYIMRDNAGNTLTWKTNTYPFQIWTEGSGYPVIVTKCTLRGTIKEHDEYNGEKQTALTRCKVVKY